jgi:hypothetical protein
MRESSIEKWRIIGSMMKENRNVTLILGDGEPEMEFWEIALNYIREVLQMVEDAERVRVMGREPAMLAPREMTARREP